MSRPLRIEFAGALYHVTSRGDRREPIFDDDADRADLLDTFSQGLARFDAACLAYCLMGNHYHLVVRTNQPNLSRFMRHVNGVYTQRFNRRHCKVGHVFQGRFNAILVDRDAYLLEVCRYVDLNPVRAGLVQRPEDWPWSSYRAHAGVAPVPTWLATDELHRHVAPEARQCDRPRKYSEFVARGCGMNLWDAALRGQIFLGDLRFVRRMQADRAATLSDGATSREVPRAQRCASVKPLVEYLAHKQGRDAGIAAAFLQGGYTQSAIAAALGLSASSVSRLIARAERNRVAKRKT
jgi:REP element-mobilizing transposase RayT